MRPDHKVAVGAIVGLTIISSMYVLNNRSFTETQKTVLMFFIILPPLQWLSILIVLLYNNTRENNTETKKTGRKIDQLKTSLDSSINHLKELYEQGIISKEKYEEKCVAIEVEKINQDLKNSIVYKKLVKLFTSIKRYKFGLVYEQWSGSSRTIANRTLLIHIFVVQGFLYLFLIWVLSV